MRTIEIMIEHLDINNRLLTIIAVGEKKSIKEKSLALLEAGLRPKDVSALLGVSPGTVTKARSRALGKTEH
jgi:DNA-binding CsgD family transcriptional regulator